MINPDIAIRERASYEEDVRFFVLQSPYGVVDATFLDACKWYNIAGIDVRHEVRRQGHGQELIRASLEHARALGATTVLAAIISRECLEAMRRVFNEGLLVTKEGDFAVAGQDMNRYSPTSAALWYDLS